MSSTTRESRDRPLAAEPHDADPRAADAADGANAPAAGVAPDERRRRDRRSRPTPMLSRYWLRGRRLRARRGDEGTGAYVDRYTRREWVLVLGIVLLSVADLVFTLLYIQAGGEEANPVMAWALDYGWEAFSLIKVGITVLGVLVLLVHVRFRGVRWALECIFGLYCLLMAYHVWLRFHLPG